MKLLDALDGARVYDLAQPLTPATPIAPTHVPFRMALLRRHGDVMREGGASSANELISLSGHTGTHIDAIAHFSRDGKLHGGVDASEAARGGNGFTQHGVHTIKPIVCRGVLLDVPRAHGREQWGAGEPIKAEHLQETCRREGLEIRAGDAVLVRTGWPIGRFEDATAYLGFETGVPGPDESGARWLADKGIRVTGSDTIPYEWHAPGLGLQRLPVHVLMLVERAIHLIEVMRLEEIARDRVYEFLFVVAPLPMVGATGSPVRPLAIAGP
jgi:kynurenine formamidase